MVWYKNRMMYLAALLGTGLGIIFLIAGLWLETQRQHLPFTLESYLALHAYYRVFFLLDILPIGFGILFGLIGLQHNLYSMVLQRNREWEIAVTQRKQVEEALNVEQYLMQALMNNVPVQIYFKDLESRFIRINNAQAELFRLSDPGQAIGKTDFDFFSKEHAQQAYDDEQIIIKTGQPISKEEKETWDNSPDKWISTTKLPLRDQDEKIIGTFGISVNITERKQIEEKLVVERNLLSTLINNIPDYIYVKDYAGTQDHFQYRRLAEGVGRKDDGRCAGKNRL